MANFQTIETIYVVTMTSLRTGRKYTLPNAYASLVAANECIDECKVSDERRSTTGVWTYGVDTLMLFR